MRWQGDAPGKYDERRYRVHFAWFPVTCIDGVRLWLERYVQEERWVMDDWTTFGCVKFTLDQAVAHQLEVR